MTRVLFVNHTARLGGAERSLLEILGAVGPGVQTALYVFEEGPLAQQARRAGAQVRVFPRPQRLTNFSRQQALRRPWRLLGLVPQAVAVMRDLAWFAGDWRADVLHANSIKAPLFALGAGRLAGVPVVCHLRDILPRRFPFTWQLGLMARLSDMVLTNSRAVAMQFSGKLRQRGRVAVAHNGLDPATLQGQAAQGLQSPLSLAPGERLLLLAGRLQHWKGQDVAIKALPLLPTDVKLGLVGQGLLQENTLAPLQALARELGVADRVLWLGERTDTPALMDRADMVLHTSREAEPFGRVVLEALLLGKPVIATRLGGPVEMIEHGQHGWLVPPDDPRSLAQAIAWVLDHPREADAVAQAGKARALSEFTLSRLIAQLRPIWDKAAQARLPAFPPGPRCC